MPCGVTTALMLVNVLAGFAVVPQPEKVQNCAVLDLLYSNDPTKLYIMHCYAALAVCCQAQLRVNN
jgi:hypothetical protein